MNGSNNMNQTAYVDGGGDSFDMDVNHTSRLQSD